MPILRRRLRENPQLPPALTGDGSSRPNESTSASRKRRKKILHAIPFVLRELLRTLKESSDFCPPLKSAIGGLSHIIENVEMMSGNKEDALRLFQKVEGLLNLLADLIPDCENVPIYILSAIERLDGELEQVSRKATQLPRRHALVRFFRTGSEHDELRKLQDELDDAIVRFNTASNVRTELVLAAMSDRTNEISDRTNEISDRTNEISQSLSFLQTSSSEMSVPYGKIMISSFLASSFKNLYMGSAINFTDPK